MQAGGSFDVDYEVTGPNGKYILDGQRERQGDFVFTANEPGEYKFCFNNEMSTFAEKFVDFEISVSSPPAQTLFDPMLTWAYSGRERSASEPPRQARHIP